MNFSSHQNNLISKIESALSKSKVGLVSDFKPILSQAKSLYKTDDFDFWLKTLGETEIDQLPMTNCGHKEAVGASKWLRKENKNRVKGTILYICESLFTYSHEDENCELQGIFHFYYSTSEKCIFKKSEMGILEGVSEVEPGSYRIAKASELDIQVGELYA
ncbi:hypothetical protein [Microbulbifer sp. GL-2]|uniref:hypothetical protein n=1 Tax=Microbulbifer sp. GL-2 TaxID=2591606 RepID=UPI001163CC59|nr:hypothetical protein [Microbulbifer sp. GL-2]BBM00137.1 hypothetical protein GL2_02110 [Microbulbifer sp. GL-2]